MQRRNDQDVHAGHPFFYNRRPSGSGATLTELMVVVAILGVVALASIPRLSFTVVHRHRAEALARKIATDLRRARSLAIRDGATHSAGYRLVVSGSDYQLVDLDSSTTVETHSIDASVTVSTGTFDFGPLGNLLSGSSNQLTVSAGNRTFTLTVTAATGTVNLTES